MCRSYCKAKKCHHHNVLEKERDEKLHSVTHKLWVITMIPGNQPAPWSPSLTIIGKFWKAYPNILPKFEFYPGWLLRPISGKRIHIWFSRNWSGAWPGNLLIRVKYSGSFLDYFRLEPIFEVISELSIKWVLVFGFVFPVHSTIWYDFDPFWRWETFPTMHWVGSSILKI